MKNKLVIILSVILFLGLPGCSKRVAGRYVCAQDIIELKSDGTLTIMDAKSGAVEMKATYKVKGDHISFIREKAKPLEGTIKGDSITIEGMPPLVRQPAK